jgi:HAD superfamily hydrolase (TIGR01509 family)
MFIFDLDGVLVDACDWHKDALNEALIEICEYQISEEEHIKTFNGIPTKVKLEILSKNKILDRNKHLDVYNAKQQKTIEIINERAIFRQEKMDLINFLKREGYIVCCYTNSIRKTAELMLFKTGILDLFDHLLTNQDVTKAKPHPEGYLHLMEKFEVDKEMCYIVEDSPKGLRAAKDSGANVIKVVNSYDLDINFIRRYI